MYEMLNNDFSFQIVNNLGLEVICDTLAVLTVDDSDVAIIYTDYTLDEKDRFNLYVSKIQKSGEEYQLTEFEDYQYIPEINAELRRIWKEMNVTN